MDEFALLGTLGSPSQELAALGAGSLPLRSKLRMLAKAVRHPGRALLRLVLWSRLARLDPAADRRRFLRWLSDDLGADGEALGKEYRNSAFRQAYRNRLAELRRTATSRRLGTSDPWCLESLYLLVRALRPRVVVETGVLYGASSAHLLAALAANGEGELYSVDLPRDPAEPSADYLVPRELRHRWTLVEGDSREELPPLLGRLGSIDCFHHDSLHTREHMTWEYETALPRIRRGGVLATHDVLVPDGLRGIFRRNAFPAFCESRGLRWRTFQNSGFARCS
jgi:predicted O-methyltransferase YrrM